MATKYSDLDKMRYLDMYKESGLSIRKFAEDNGIPESTFSGWLKEEDEFGFGEISIKPKSQEIPKQVKKTAVFANETVRIELKEGFNKDFVLKIVEVLVNAK